MRTGAPLATSHVEHAVKTASCIGALFFHDVTCLFSFIVNYFLELKIKAALTHFSNILILVHVQHGGI